MQSVADYVKMVANTMGKNLSDEVISKLANDLISSETYNEMLAELETKIKDAAIEEGN